MGILASGYWPCCACGYAKTIDLTLTLYAETLSRGFLLYCRSMKENYDVIIVGGGVAGLGALEELQKHHKNVLLISKDFGGRLCSSADGQINYGAYIVPKTDTMISSLVTRTEKVRPFHTSFHFKKHGYTFWHVLRHWRELLSFYPFLISYRKTYKKFRGYATEHGIHQAFKKFPKVRALQKISANTFIKRHRIDLLTKHILDEPVWMCTFAKIKNLNAFDFLHIAMYFGVPIHKFVSNVPTVVRRLKKYLKIDEVTSIKDGSPITVTLKGGSDLTCSHLILATPYDVTRKFVNIAHDRLPCEAYLFHVKGKLNYTYKDADLELFQENNETLFVSKEADGTTIFYSTKPDPDLDEFFESHQVIHSQHWNPAFYLGGHKIINPDYSDTITLAGDLNTVGMEDTYRSGVYAARRVIRQLAKK